LLYIKKIIHTLIFGNIFVSICAASLCAETLLLCGYGKIFNTAVALTFFSTLFIYNYQRAFSFQVHDTVFRSIRHGWISKNRNTSITLVVISTIGIITCLFFLVSEIYFLLFPLFVISFFYSSRLAGLKVLSFRLRELPFLKIFLVALVWSATEVILPIVQEEGTLKGFSYKNMLLFVGQFFFVFAITLPFDVRDLELDKQKGIKTFPVRFGVGATKLLMLFCCGLSFMSWFLAYDLFAGIEKKELVALSFCLSCTAVLLLSTSTKRNEYFYAAWIEGLSLLQFLAVLVSQVL
jgi:4-hydroxybenzoate polyprenyltransferase